MSDEAPTPAAPTDEEVAIDHAVDRLAERFPQVPRDRIVDLVHQRHIDYTGAPVRDFIPVLIEHDVKRELAAEATPLA
ncbi:three-helix bundle dimerization domain-containing protein [Leifsonia shinshuensis]